MIKINCNAFVGLFDYCVGLSIAVKRVSECAKVV